MCLRLALVTVKAKISFFTLLDSSGVGRIDVALINEYTQGSNVCGNYKKYTDDDYYKIGEYASENGSAATVQKSKSDFPKLNDSAVRDFKRKYREKLKISNKKSENISTLVKREKRTLLLLGKLEKMVQKISKLH